MAYLKRKRNLVIQFISLSILAKSSKVILGVAMSRHHMMDCVKRRRANCANFRAFSEPPIDLQPSTHGLRRHQHIQTWRSGVSTRDFFRMKSSNAVSRDTRKSDSSFRIFALICVE